MGLIKGITIKLYRKVLVGKDDFNRPIYKEEPIEIENVLIAPVSAGEVINETNLNGKKAVYTLAIPKEDQNEWENRTVEFFGKRWRTIGHVIEGLEQLIPLGWNKKVTVERYG